MDFRLFLMISALGASMASAQQVLYEEVFPYSGPPGGVMPISSAGWANDIRNNPNRLFQESGTNGAVFAFQGTKDVPISTGFYTTTQLDNGATGMAFAPINPEAYFCVILSADIRPGVNPEHIEARFAVQMNGSNWFVSATALPVPSVRGPFATYAQQFRDSASDWNTLTLNGTSVSIGESAASNLGGNITGAGLVFTHTIDNGTYDFDNFRITASLGEVAITSVLNEQATLSWFGAPGIRLQSTSGLEESAWGDVPNTSGQSTATVPMATERMFFRLVK